MDLHQYLLTVRKLWWVILIPMVLGGAYGTYKASNVTPTYRASVTFFVATSGDPTVQGAVQGDQFAQRRVNSYVALLSTDRLANMVVETLDSDLTSGEVRGMISATGDLDTVLLTARVTSTSRALAQEVADAVAVDFVTLVDEVESSDDNPASVSLEVVSGPSVRQMATQGKITTAVYAFFGMLLGLGLAVLLELRDSNFIRSEEQLQALGAGPVVGKIPFDRRVRSSPLVVESDQRSQLAEAFRQLRTNLQFVDVERPVQVLVVTSSVPAEGKSVVASNLALSLAATHRRVLVIEGDMRRPTLADHFGMPRTVGLTDLIAGGTDLEEVLQGWAKEGLAVLPCGPLPPNPSELLGSAAMRRLVEALRERFDMIIIDTPPLLPVTDAAVAASWADGVVLVVRSGKTTRSQVSHSVQALRAVNARVLGAVMTMAPSKRGVGYEAYEQGTSRGRTPERSAGPPWLRAALRSPAAAHSARRARTPARAKPVSGTRTDTGPPVRAATDSAVGSAPDRAGERGAPPAGPSANGPGSGRGSGTSAAGAPRRRSGAVE